LVNACPGWVSQTALLDLKVERPSFYKADDVAHRLFESFLRVLRSLIHTLFSVVSFVSRLMLTAESLVKGLALRDSSSLTCSFDPL
jgi:hypothetical protein